MAISYNMTSPTQTKIILKEREKATDGNVLKALLIFLPSTQSMWGNRKFDFASSNVIFIFRPGCAILIDCLKICPTSIILGHFFHSLKKRHFFSFDKMLHKPILYKA